MDFRGYEPVIGLEIHAQLKTQSKMFCSDSTKFDALDNENTSPVSVGMPGALPVINKKAVEMSIQAGLALGCQIRHKSVFARKNYFYPDLPKGYQISQYDQPLCEHGKIQFVLDNEVKTISITRAHMEEDAGQSQHIGEYTLINYNRSGVPLLEIVSGPDLRTAKEAAEYARTVRQILRYLDVCDGNLEEGSLRCDCNVSVRKIGAPEFGTKVEIKNINSFRFIEKAIEFEIDRQIDMVEQGQKISQETRLFDPDKNQTISMRSKENAQEYRYFPDPDLLPVIVTDEEIQRLKSLLPELPVQRAQRFIKEFQLPEYDALILTAEKELADYFEKTALQSKNAKAASNWIMTELLRELKQTEKHISQSPVSEATLSELIGMIDQNIISGKMAKSVFSECWKTGKSPAQIVKEHNWVQITDTNAIEKVIEDILAQNPSQVADFRGGRTKVFGFFVGLAMKATKGQASPDLVNQILTIKLSGQ